MRSDKEMTMVDRSWWKALGAGVAGLALLSAGVACSKAEEPTTPASTEAPATSAPGTTEAEQDAEVAAFCESIEEVGLVEMGESDMDPTDDEALGEYVEALNEVTQYVPDAIYDDWEIVRVAISDLYELDADERTDALFEMVDDEELLDAQDAVDEYTEEQCGFAIGGDSTDDTMDEDTTTGTGRSSGGSGSDDDGTGSGGSSGSGSDDGDFGTDDGDFGTDEDDPLSTDALKTYLDDNYGSEAWVEQVNSWGIVTFNDEAQVTVGTMDTWTSDQGVEVCEAISEWLFGLADEGSVTVSDSSGELAARASYSEECVAT